MTITKEILSGRGLSMFRPTFSNASQLMENLYTTDCTVFNFFSNSMKLDEVICHTQIQPTNMFSEYLDQYVTYF